MHSCRPESTAERVNALIFPKAAAAAGPVMVECEVTGPLLAATAIVIWDTDHRASITSALTVAQVGKRPGGCWEMRNLKDRNGWSSHGSSAISDERRNLGATSGKPYLQLR